MAARKKPAARTAEHIAADLADLADAIEKAKALYVQRAELFREARQLDPPMPYTEIARAAGVSKSAVLQVLERL